MILTEFPQRWIVYSVKYEHFIFPINIPSYVEIPKLYKFINKFELKDFNALKVQRTVVYIYGLNPYFTDKETAWHD